MRKSEKITKIEEVLNAYFPQPGIPLDHKDSFTLLIAVLLSAQCTDARVNLVTPQLFALADNPQKMAQQKISDVQAIIRPCGLSPTKAKAIVALSQILVEKYAGQVPDSFEALEELPGVGHKTASVVMAQAFKVPAFPIDTHIFRCAKRWGLSKANNVNGVEKDLKRCFAKHKWIKLHLQIIYFARAYCTALKHDFKHCPICSWLAK